MKFIIALCVAAGLAAVPTVARAQACCSVSDCPGSDACNVKTCDCLVGLGTCPLCMSGLGTDGTCVSLPAHRCTDPTSPQSGNCCDPIKGTCAANDCSISCTTPWADCDGNLGNGCEIDLSHDTSNCGGCGIKCSAKNITASCSGFTCNGTCAAGFADCNANKQSDGCETKITSDPSNCGGCGLVCSTNNVSSSSCGSGVCTSPCVAGFGDCNGNKLTDGCEVNLNGDANNCGGCGVACSTNHVTAASCSAGACNSTCAAGFADCNGNKQSDGCEQPLSGDIKNCGACGAVCSTNHIPTPTCTGIGRFFTGVCNGACAAGFADCNGNKLSDGCETDTNNDVHHCGGCGTDCTVGVAHASGVACSSGACVYVSCATGFNDCDGNRLNGCETTGACPPPPDLLMADLSPPPPDLSVPRDLSVEEPDMATPPPSPDLSTAKAPDLATAAPPPDMAESGAGKGGCSTCPVTPSLPVGWSVVAVLLLLTLLRRRVF
jgi:hypothetical protein